jgi:hypothetical protein
LLYTLPGWLLARGTGRECLGGHYAGRGHIPGIQQNAGGPWEVLCGAIHGMGQVGRRYIEKRQGVEGIMKTIYPDIMPRTAPYIRERRDRNAGRDPQEREWANGETS